MSFTICALISSTSDLTGRSTLLQERSLARMLSPTRHLIVPFLHCPVVSAKSIYFDASTANQRYRLDLQQDDADQVRYMLTSEAMSLEWPVPLPAGSDQSRVSPSHEDPNDEHPEDALPTLPH